MALILALEGCMAAGKTSAAGFVAQSAPEVHVSYERTAETVERVRARGLDKRVFADYVEIQKLWIQNEIDRYERARAYPVTLTDFGAAEIEFYTLCYPKSIGENWDVEGALQEDLRRLRECMPRRILFLRARDETLRARKTADGTRSRTFFEHHLQRLMPLKHEWFLQKETVDVMDVDGMTAMEEGRAVLEWVRRCERRFL